MNKRKYNTPAVRITRINLMHRMLLSSGQDVGIPHGAKENTIFDIEESDEQE